MSEGDFLKWTLVLGFEADPEVVDGWSWQTWYEGLAFLDMKNEITEHEMERSRNAHGA